MITLCTVVETNGPLSRSEIYAPLMIDTVFKFCPLVSEVLIASPADEPTEHTEGKVTKFGFVPADTMNTGSGWNYHHAMGLHACIDRAKNEYLLMSDPDVIFFSDVASLYLDLMNKCGLFAVGIANVEELLPKTAKPRYDIAAKLFPVVTNLMVKKKDLPPSDFLRGLLRVYKNKYFTKVGMAAKKEYERLLATLDRGLLVETLRNLAAAKPLNEFDPSGLVQKPPDVFDPSGICFLGEPDPGIPVDGKYLIQGIIPEIADKFPQPDGLFEIGNNLFLWNLETNGKYISFTDYKSTWGTYTEIFSTREAVGNFGEMPTIPIQLLVYHLRGCSWPDDDADRKLRYFTELHDRVMEI